MRLENTAATAVAVITTASIATTVTARKQHPHSTIEFVNLKMLLVRCSVGYTHFQHTRTIG